MSVNPLPTLSAPPLQANPDVSLNMSLDGPTTKKNDVNKKQLAGHDASDLTHLEDVSESAMMEKLRNNYEKHRPYVRVLSRRFVRISYSV